MIAIDTETYLIEPGCLAPKIVCLTMYDEDERGPLIWDDVVVPGIPTVAEDLLRCEDPIVGHNVAYDMGVLAANFPDLQPLIWQAYEEDRVRDTMIRAMLIAIARDQFMYDPDRRRHPSFSLAGVAEKYLDLDLAKGDDTWRLRYAELDGVPLGEWPEEAVEYAKKDAEVTARVWRKMGELGTPKDECLQVRAAWALHLMSCWGLKIDQEAVAKLKKNLEDDLSERWERLKEVGIVRENDKKSLAVTRERVREAFKARGEKAPETPKGAVKTDKDALEQSGDPLLQLLAEANAIKKNLTDFIPKLEYSVVNPRFKVIVRSGRTACANPNIQQMPRLGGFRECFRPRDGYIYIIADYAIAELCALADVCKELIGFSKLGDMILAGQDPHLVTGADIIGIGYEEALERYEVGDKEVKDARQLAKAMNFGLPGGLGPATFVKYARSAWNVVITEEQAVDLKGRWLLRYPEMPLFFQYVGEKGNDHTVVQLRSGRVRGGLNFCNGCNTYFQGLVADGAKDALWEVSRLCYGYEDDLLRLSDGEVLDESNFLFGCRPVAFIHDEILMEAPKEYAYVAADGLEWVMVAAMKRWIRSVPIHVDTVISDRWTK